MQVTTGNSIGTVCGWDGSYMTDSRFPTLDGATSPFSISYNNQGLTGTLPTQFGLMTEATKSSISDNQLTGKRKVTCIFPPDSSLDSRLAIAGILGPQTSSRGAAVRADAKARLSRSPAAARQQTLQPMCHGVTQPT